MKIGDIVNLKAGGALMTVIAVDGDLITTMWTDNECVPHEADIPEEALERPEVEMVEN